MHMFTFAENALPELAAHSFHSTIFVLSAHWEAIPTWTMEHRSLDSDEIVRSSQRIATFPSSLVTLRSHPRAHPHLSESDHDDTGSKSKVHTPSLREFTAQDIRLLAFPYGDYDASVVELCRHAGYDYVFTTTPHGVDTASANFVRGRVKVEPFDGPLEFFLKYNGAYAWTSIVSSLKKKLKSITKGSASYPTDRPVPTRRV